MSCQSKNQVGNLLITRVIILSEDVNRDLIMYSQYKYNLIFRICANRLLKLTIRFPYPLN
jgi:hypothetical protein